jgi:hypothetical protein
LGFPELNVHLIKATSQTLFPVYNTVGIYSDIRDQRYQTELDIGTSDIGLKRAESDIISDIGINFYPISDIRHPKIHKSAQWLRKQVSWVRILLM